MAIWELSWEPSDIGIPHDMIDAYAEAKNAADCINLAQANHHHRAKTGKRIMEVNTANMRLLMQHTVA